MRSLLVINPNTSASVSALLQTHVQAAAGGVSFDAPEGKVTVNGENHHIAKTALIGQIHDDGLIYTVWSSKGPIEPDPFLKGYPWWKGATG